MHWTNSTNRTNSTDRTNSTNSRIMGLIAAICIGLFLFDAKNLCISRTCTKDSFEKILP